MLQVTQLVIPDSFRQAPRSSHSFSTPLSLLLCGVKVGCRAMSRTFVHIHIQLLKLQAGQQGKFKVAESQRHTFASKRRSSLHGEGPSSGHSERAPKLRHMVAGALWKGCWVKHFAERGKIKTDVLLECSTQSYWESPQDA